MAEQVQIEVTGFQSLKAQIKEAQVEYQKLLASTSATPAQIDAAAQKVGDLKDRLSDAAASAQALGTAAGKFQAFTKGAAAISGGFTALQGAIGLAGGNAKEFEKTIQKVQSAMALTQGLTALSELGDAFNNMKSVAVAAFNSIKTAIGSTGIGLLVVALGAIYAYWDDIKAVVSGVSEEQKALNAEAEANVKAQQDALDAISGQEEVLKLAGKSEEEILQMKHEQTKELIKATEIQLEQQEATKKAQVEAAQRNKDILQGIIRFISIPITALLSAVDAVGKAFGKDFGLEEGFSGGIAKLVFDPEAIAKEGDNAIAETRKKLDKLKNDDARFQNQINENRKKKSAERQAILDKEAEAAQKKREEEIKSVQEGQQQAYLATLSASEKEEYLVNQKYTKLLDLARKYGQDTTALEAGRQAELKAISDKAAEEAKQKAEKEAQDKIDRENRDTQTAIELMAARAKTIQEKRDADIAAVEEEFRLKIEAAKKNGDDIVALEELKAERIKAIQKQSAEDEKQIVFARMQLQAEFLQEVANAFGNLAGLFKQNSKAQKIAALAEIGISTAAGFIRALAIAQQSAAGTGPGAAFAFPIFYASQIAAVLGAAAKAKSVLGKSDSAESGSSSGKGGGNESTPVPSKFAQGGLLYGRKHAEGGIMTGFGQLEGGEYVINRSSTAAFLPLLDRINSMGNGSGAPNNMSVNAEHNSASQPIIKTYVVASEMTSQQEANKRISDLARL